MKNSLLRTFFEWALITSVLMSVGFFIWYYVNSRAVRVAESRISVAQTSIQNNHTVMGVLLNECHEYGKTNTDMARLLTSGGSSAAPAATVTPVTPAPTAKPRK